MNASSRSNNKNDFAVSSNRRVAARHNSRNVLPALVALGSSCGFVCGPALALELGDLDVQSTLGQPLRASIAFALNPNEAIHGYCIYLKPGAAADGLPAIGHASIAVSNGFIRLTGIKAIKEPLLTLQLSVDCPYTAHLSREYVVFVNSQSLPRSEPVREAAGTPAASPATAQSGGRAGTSSTLPVRSANRAPIAMAGSYRVQRGDTLSGIAERISGRSVGIWQAVDAIFAANPGAFLDSDRNLLKAGALLVIPATLQAAGDARESVPAVAKRTDSEVASPGQSPHATAYAGYSATAVNGESLRTTDAGTAAQLPVDAGTASGGTSQAAAIELPRAPRAGDISLGADSPFVAPIGAPGDTAEAASPFKQPTEVIPETSIAVSAAAEIAAPVRPQAADGGTSGSWSWLLWLGGSGIALIFGLLLFGRRFRGGFGGDADWMSGEPAHGRRRTDGDGRNLPAGDVSPVVDFQFDEPLPGARVIALDGDLEAGTGFQDSDDIDVAEDFGFSASGDFQMGLDIEFSAEPAVQLEEQHTDMIPTGRRATDTILVSEVLPGNDEGAGDYNLSMIVDATQQPAEDSDDTTRDLQAIELDMDDTVDADGDPLTLSKAVEYNILEQDYEEELTATQALNVELLQAARELSARLIVDADDSAAPDSPTAHFATPGEDLTALPPESQDLEITVERTVEMPAEAGKRDLSDLDDTGVNEEITTEIPLADNDATVDIAIESATIDTKKKKAS